MAKTGRIIKILCFYRQLARELTNSNIFKASLLHCLKKTFFDALSSYGR